MKIIIKNANVYNKSHSEVCDIIINNSVIEKITQNTNETADKVIDAEGLAVFPGFVDMHCHLREPGFEYKEDILSGTKAAVAGGFTSVACMPNTNPVIDNVEIVKYVQNRAKECNLAKVYPIAAITKGQKGMELSEIGELKAAGAVAISDDGRPVENALIMYNALLYSKPFDMLLISHCEDLSLASDGVVNEGFNATVSGLKGITRASEEVMVAREIILAETLNTRLHIAHISTAGSVSLIRDAKKRGVQVTCETCPHYFSATDDYILNYDTNAKVNPPLRTHDDKQAIIEGIKDGTIDVIATDHAPHHIDEKNLEFSYAANGISGLETAFSLSYTNLVKAGHISLNKLVELMSYAPSKIFKIEAGQIKEGLSADIVIANLNEEYEINRLNFLSKGKNTPFEGQKVFGKIKYTLVSGDIKYTN